MTRHENDYTLYEKRGRRYYPVREYDSKIHDAFPKGFCLVHTEPGVTSLRFNIDPAVPEVLAALKLLEDAMCAAMRDESIWAPNKPLTRKQREAYEAYVATMGDGIYHLSRKSVADIVAAGCKVLEKHLKETRCESQ